MKPGNTLSLASVNPLVQATFTGGKGGGPTPAGKGGATTNAVALANASGSVLYSVRVMIPLVSGTNCRFNSPAPANLRTMTWTVGGTSVVTNFNYSTAYPAYVRYDSTHFKDMDSDANIIWSVGEGTEGTSAATAKPWKKVEVAVVYNRYAVRSDEQFEKGQDINGTEKFGLAVQDDIVAALEGMNHFKVGVSDFLNGPGGYTKQDLIGDAKKATAQHFSAHGNSYGIYLVSHQDIAGAVALRSYGLPSFNVIFASSCSTSKKAIPPLATAYEIIDGAQDKVYVGFTDIVYIAGAQAAARVFWNKLKDGETAGATRDDAMRAYQAELEKVKDDPDLSQYIVVHRYELNMQFTGDASTKLHGLYKLPTSYLEQGNAVQNPLTWMVSYGQGDVAIKGFTP